jgi:hypothetical protein
MRATVQSEGFLFQPGIIEQDINSFSLYDADRIEKARKQVDEGHGSCHELIEV